MFEPALQPKLTAIPKPWVISETPNASQRRQILTIACLFSLWLHVLFFGLWQVSSWRLIVIDEMSFELPVLELSINFIPDEVPPDDVPEALAALNQEDRAVFPEPAPPEEPVAQVAALSEAALTEPAAAPLNDQALVEAAAVSEAIDESMNVLAELPPEMKKYSTATKNKIWQKWVIPPDSYKGGVYIAEITIDQKGTLTRIITKNSSGDSILDHAAMEAIKAASPFDRFPNSMSDLAQYSYEVVFNYDVKKVPVQPARTRNGKKKRPG